MPDLHLIVDGVSKTFGELRANDGVDLNVQRGTIHAILGENGAGKTTLMNILYGLLQPDAGRITLNGKDVRIDSPRTAIELGIGMVHQHYALVGPLTVTENVVLGLEGALSQLDLSGHEARLRELSDSFGFETEPREMISRLPVGMQQRVEILKALYRNADLLILDEPTSVLTPGEIDSFFAVLRRLKESGRTVIFITHKLEEVMTLADRVTVMRGGQVTDELATNETDSNQLARLMVGRDVIFDIERPEGTAGAPCSGHRGCAPTATAGWRRSTASTSNSGRAKSSASPGLTATARPSSPNASPGSAPTTPVQ